MTILGWQAGHPLDVCFWEPGWVAPSETERTTLRAATGFGDVRKMRIELAGVFR